MEGSGRESTTGRRSAEGTVQSCGTKEEEEVASRRMGGGAGVVESQQGGEGVVFFEVEAIAKDSQAHQSHKDKSLYNLLTYNTPFSSYSSLPPSDLQRQQIQEFLLFIIEIREERKVWCS